MPPPLSSPLTSLLGIAHPIMLAGMDQVAGPELVAAVTNAGGFGVLGGARYTPRMLQEMLDEMKGLLKDPKAPFGVDLLVPSTEEGARRTNYDYTKGHLSQLIDIIVASGAKIFVSAVGVSPQWVIDKLHSAGVLYANIVGHPKHVHKACKAGADLIIAQGGEGGGHTGDIATSILVPACADICAQYTSPLTKQPVVLVAAGGINDGRSVASALMLGASGVWIGTRFIVAKESKASKEWKARVIAAGYDSWVKSLVWTGRPLRALANPYLKNWEEKRQGEIRKLTGEGIVPLVWEMERLEREGKLTDEIVDAVALRPIGVVGGAVNKPDQSAKEIVEEIVRETVVALNGAKAFVNPESKL